MSYNVGDIYISINPSNTNGDEKIILLSINENKMHFKVLKNTTYKCRVGRNVLVYKSQVIALFIKETIK